jgi:hypothetical protein
MSDFWKYLNNKVKKHHNEVIAVNNKKYTGEVGYVPDSYLIGKKTHSNITIDECIKYANPGDGKSPPSTYFGFSDTGEQTKCWVPKKNEYSFDNQIVNKPKKTKSSDMAMYFTPTGDISCGDNKDCIKQYELSKLEKLKKQYSDQVTAAQQKAADLALTKMALENGVTYEEAKQKQKVKLEAQKARELMKSKLLEQKKLLAQLTAAKKQQKTIQGVVNIASAQTKTINNKIDNNYDQISQLNSKIVKTSEMIDNNNRLFFMKGKVTKVLIIILAVLTLIAITMIIYYSSKSGLIKTPNGLASFIGLNPNNATKSISAKLTTPANIITMGKPT